MLGGKAGSGGGVTSVTVVTACPRGGGIRTLSGTTGGWRAASPGMAGTQAGIIFSRGAEGLSEGAGTSRGVFSMAGGRTSEVTRATSLTGASCFTFNVGISGSGSRDSMDGRGGGWYSGSSDGATSFSPDGDMAGDGLGNLSAKGRPRPIFQGDKFTSPSTTMGSNQL